MPDPRKPSLILPVAVALAVLLLLAGYVGAYYASVEPGIVVTDAANHPFDSFDKWGRLPKDAVYLFGDQTFDGWFFAPIHWLDRRIRPHVWEAAE